MDKRRQGGKRRVAGGRERLCRVRSKRKRMRRAFARIMKMRWMRLRARQRRVGRIIRLYFVEGPTSRYYRYRYMGNDARPERRGVFVLFSTSPSLVKSSLPPSTDSFGSRPNTYTWIFQLPPRFSAFHSTAVIRFLFARKHNGWDGKGGEKFVPAQRQGRRGTRRNITSPQKLISSVSGGS